MRTGWKGVFCSLAALSASDCAANVRVSAVANKLQRRVCCNIQQMQLYKSQGRRESRMRKHCLLDDQTRAILQKCGRERTLSRASRLRMELLAVFSCAHYTALISSAEAAPCRFHSLPSRWPVEMKRLYSLLPKKVVQRVGANGITNRWGSVLS